MYGLGRSIQAAVRMVLLVGEQFAIETEVLTSTKVVTDSIRNLKNGSDSLRTRRKNMITIKIHYLLADLTRPQGKKKPRWSAKFERKECYLR